MDQRRVSGSDLQIGDVIETWWSPNRDTIISMADYRGPYQNDICKGARIASFALLRSGMTIFPNDDFTLIARTGA